MDQREELPDVLSAEQRKAMLAEIQEASRTRTGHDLTAAAMHIVILWHTRGARLYASNAVSQAREDFALAFVQLNEKMAACQRDVTYWTSRCEVLELTVQSLSLQLQAVKQP